MVGPLLVDVEQGWRVATTPADPVFVLPRWCGSWSCPVDVDCAHGSVA